MASSKKKIDTIELPSTPKDIWTPLGLVELSEVEGLADSNGSTACGMWLNGARTIKLAAGMHPITTAQTIGHELMHTILHDSGIHLGKKKEEMVCDAFGSYYAAWVLNKGEYPFSIDE